MKLNFEGEVVVIAAHLDKGMIAGTSFDRFNPRFNSEIAV